MSDLDVETEITPPEVDEETDGDDSPSARLGVSWISTSEVHYGADTQFFGDDCEDPAKFADALLRTALALANLRGPDHAWETMRRFTTYDGGMS